MFDCTVVLVFRLYLDCFLCRMPHVCYPAHDVHPGGWIFIRENENEGGIGIG